VRLVVAGGARDGVPLGMPDGAAASTTEDCSTGKRARPLVSRAPPLLPLFAAYDVLLLVT